MKVEIEVKFLSVNHGDLREKLKDAGAECEQPMRLLRRVIIKTPELLKKNGYLRVRDEGYRVTMTCKIFDEYSVDGAKEIETTVGSFDDTVEMFAAAGMAYQSFQESKRETWVLDGCEVVLDEWPWLKPYVEIEGDNEQAIRDMAEKLGFVWSDAVFGDIMAAYRAEYPHLTMEDSVADMKEVRFGDPLPELLDPKGK